MQRQRGLTEALGEAIADVRQKVVEEGWFGRTVTPPPMNVAPSMSEALGWALPQKERTAGDLHPGDEPGLTQALAALQQDSKTPDPEPPERGYERGIDR
jgi:hypothetical protein